MSKHWHVLIWLILIPVLAWIGHGLLFTSFMIYDDEGYILLTLRNQIEHGGLYDKVYSQYGPFFYALLGSLSRILDFEWTNTSGRWFTLVNWLGASGLCGLLVWRRDRRWTAALFTTATVFSSLWIMISEPVHPGGLITLFVALAAVIGAECVDRQSPKLFALFIGTSGALISLTKINAGAFLVIAGGLWLLATLGGRLRGTALALGAVISVSLPFMLMRLLMHQPWVPVYALLVALSTISVFIVASERGRGTSSPSNLLWFTAAGLGASLVVVAWSLMQGTSLSGLLHGVLLAPLKHPDVYSFAVKWRPFVMPVAIIGLALTFTWAIRPRSSVVQHSVALARLIITTITAYAILPWTGSSIAVLSLCYGVPTAALFAIPLRESKNHGSGLVRPWLALLLCLQSMQSYPIAGSQLNWGTFLWIPLMTLGMADAVEFWTSRMRTPWTGILRLSLATAICGLSILELHYYVRILNARLTNSMALALPHAEDIKLSPPDVSALHIIAVNARQNANTLFSLPGAFSYNLWTERPTPTLKNVTHWFSLLSNQEQQEIIQAMSADPNAALVVQRPLLEFLHQNGFPVSGPLVSYLHGNYRQAVTVDGISLWIKRDRADVIPFLIAETEPTPGGGRVGVNLPPTNEPITHLEAVYYDTNQAAILAKQDGQAVPQSLNPRIRPIALPGQASNAEIPLVWPLPPGSARRLTFDFPVHSDAAGRQKWIFRFVSNDGRTLGFARFAR